MHIIVSFIKVGFELKSAHMLMRSKMFFRKTKYYNFTCSQFTSALTMGCKGKKQLKKLRRQNKKTNHGCDYEKAGASSHKNSSSFKN